MPFHLPRLNFIELLFHLRGKLHIQQIRKRLHQQIIRLFADVGRLEFTFLFLDVLTVNNRFHCRRICTRPANPKLFERLDQRRLRVTRRRNRKMLFRTQLAQIHLLANRQRRHSLVGIIIGALILVAFINAVNLKKTGKRNFRSRNTEGVITKS